MICIIPARGGSTRIPKKNIKLFHGKPIICYSIENALTSNLFERVIVSTDCAETAQIAKEFGAEVLMRDPEFCRNEVGTQEVMKHVLDGLDYVGDACCLYATAPLLDFFYLSTARLLMNFGKNDDWIGLSIYNPGYIISVGTNPLHDCGQFYMGPTANFRKKIPLITAQTRLIPMPDERCCDINTPEDWARAEIMYADLIHKELPWIASI